MDIETPSTLMLLDQLLPGRQNSAVDSQRFENGEPRLAVFYLTGPLANSFSVWPHLPALGVRLVLGMDKREVRGKFKQEQEKLLATPSRVSILFALPVTPEGDAPGGSQGSQGSTSADQVRAASVELESIEATRDATRSQATAALEEVHMHMHMQMHMKLPSAHASHRLPRIAPLVIPCLLTSNC